MIDQTTIHTYDKGQHYLYKLNYMAKEPKKKMSNSTTKLIHQTQAI